MANLKAETAAIGQPLRLRPNQTQPFEGRANRHGVRDLDAMYGRKRNEERKQALIKAALEAEASELEKSAASRLLLAEEWQKRADTLRSEISRAARDPSR